MQLDYGDFIVQVHAVHMCIHVKVVGHVCTACLCQDHLMV